MTSTPRHRAPPTRLPALALALGALGFIGFGLAFLLAPGLLGLVELDASTPSARSDVRAVYGGIELGVGAFLAVCARRAPWQRAGLTAQALMLGGAALGRVASVAADGLPRPLALGLGALELLGAVLTVVALRALREAFPR
jgi:hypothetical protein